MDDQRIKLILELAGASDVAELRAQLDGLNAAGGTAAKGLGQVEDQLREETAAIAEAVRQQKELKAATDACAKADADLNKALRDDAAAELRGKLAALDAEAGDVAEAFARGDISARMFAKDMDTIGDEAAQLKTQLAGLERAQRSEAAATDRATAAKDRLAKATKKAGQGMTGFGQSMLQTGRIVQDVVQGGIGGGINNIEGFVQAIGLGSGAAGALTILGTAFLVFRPQIEEFVKGLNIGGGGVKDFTTRIETLQARIKELEGKDVKLTVDIQELRDAKAVVEEIRAALAEVDKLNKSQKSFEKQSGAAIEELIAEAPGGAQGVHQTLRDQMAPEARTKAAAPFTAQEERTEREIIEAEREAANLANAGQAGAAATVRGTIDRLRKELEQLKDARLKAIDAVMAPKGGLDQEIGAVLEGAEHGAGAVQAEHQRKLADMLRKSGQEGPAVGVEAANPRQMQEDAQFIERQQHGAKLDKDLAKKAADDLEASAKEARDKVKDKLDEFKAGGGVEAVAKESQEEADTRGLKGADAFNHVRDGLMAAIEGALKGANLDVKFSRDQIADLATAAAGGARKADSGAAAKGEKQQDAGIARQAREQRAKADKEQAETFDQSVKNSGIAGEAGAMLAEIQAAGGVRDQRTGKVRKLTPEQQLEYVRKQVERYLHRQTGVDQFGRKTFANAGMGAEETGLTATAIAQRGQQEVTHRLAGMAGQQGTNTQKLLNIAGMMSAEVAQLQQQIRHQAQQIDGLGREVQARRQPNRKVIH